MLKHHREVWDELIGPGGPFELEALPGRPGRIYKNAPADMRDLWERSAFEPDQLYVVYEDEHHTAGDIDARVRSLAWVLWNDYGIRPGDRVAVAMRNYPEWIVSHWAICAIGATTVGCNAWWTGPEMEFGLIDSGARVLIADEERIDRLLPHLGAVRQTTPPADGHVVSDTTCPLPIIAVRAETDRLPDGAVRWDDVVEPSSAPARLPDVAIDPDGEFCIFYTSGTTGTPKGAVLTHRGAVTNVVNCQFMAAAAFGAAARASGAPPSTPAGPVVTLVGTPLFHVTACNCLLHPGTLAGTAMVFMRKWDAGRALELIERERITSVSGVPVMSRELLLHPDWGRRDTSSLKGMGGGGAAFHPDLVDKVDKALPEGTPGTGYGLTETTGIVTSNFGPTCLIKPSSVGPVVPTLDARLVDESGEVLPAGPDQVGRLQVRGPVVFAGYLNRPDATAEVMDGEWFDTGDIARIDGDGFVHLVDRAKDMVNRGGENVSCGEVETAIHDHLDVAEVAVFGVPDERLGEEVAAVVVPAPGTAIDVDSVQVALRDHLSPYKIPRHVWVRDTPLPRNANGKFLKRELRDEYGVS